MININSIVDEYLKAFPGEKTRLGQLTDLLQHTPNKESLISRKNFVGHITVSGLVISRQRGQVLLVYNPLIHLNLAPGGHLLPSDESPLQAAKRIIREKASITNFEYFPFHFVDEVPIDIDTHTIPENKTENEPTHRHCDLRYLFICDDLVEEPSRGETRSGPMWCDVNELQRMSTYSSVKDKIQEAFSAEFGSRRFYRNLVNYLDIHEKISTIVVAHFIPDVMTYLRALDRLTDILAIIPKPNSIDEGVNEIIKSKFRVERFTREQIADTEVIDEVVKVTSNKVILFDIGGYFAPAVDRLTEHFPDKLLGVIEDTENGHQKYEALKSLPLPVISVARSPLKDNEDFLVGQSIVFSADSILRDAGKLIQYLNCSVLGYGKVGRSIAYHLLLKGLKPNVYDTNPMKCLEAYNQLCAVPTKREILRNSDVIFCATGNQALSIGDFRELRNGCFVFSVTSSDDELDLTFVSSEYTAEEASKNVTRYSSFSNYFYLVNNGNAVNFVHRAVLGDFIQIVRGEMLYALKALLAEDLKPGLHEVSPDGRQALADLWLNTFVREKIGASASRVARIVDT